MNVPAFIAMICSRSTRFGIEPREQRQIFLKNIDSNEVGLVDVGAGFEKEQNASEEHNADKVPLQLNDEERKDARTLGDELDKLRSKQT
jgi:hypothetical protein